MKKIITLITLFMITISATSSFAAALAAGAKTTTDGQTLYGGITTAIAGSATSVLLGKTSKGVYAGVFYDAANGVGYAIDTKHISGTKAFGCGHDTTAIYTTELGTGDNLVAPTANGMASFTSWTPM